MYDQIMKLVCMLNLEYVVVASKFKELSEEILWECDGYEESFIG